MFKKHLLSSACVGMGLTFVVGFVLAFVDYRVRDNAFVWMVWCIPGILAVPMFRVERLNAFVTGMLSAGFFVFGFLGAGIAGPSTIAGGFAAVWSAFFAVLLVCEWAIVRLLWPPDSQLETPLKSADVQPVRDSGNPYQPPP